MEEKRENKHNLLIGLVALLAVIVVVAAVGYFISRPEKVILQGEAEATEYRVSGKVPGRIEKFYVIEGQQVHKGDTLVAIDSPEIRAKLMQATAARSAAEAQNRKAIVGARQEQIVAAYEMWQKAKAGEDIMDKSFQRVDRLFEKGVVSQQKRDEAEAQYKAATATAKAAESQYNMAVNGAQKEDRDAALALVERAEGAVSEVESYMSELYLRAPADGEVTELFPKQGELVGTGSPIMSITDLDDVWFTFSIREDLLDKIAVGRTVSLTIPALGKSTYNATVTSMNAMMSYATWRATKASGQFDAKTFEVKAHPVDKIENLRPGMSAIIECVVE